MSLPHDFLKSQVGAGLRLVLQCREGPSIQTHGEHVLWNWSLAGGEQSGPRQVLILHTRDLLDGVRLLQIPLTLPWSGLRPVYIGFGGLA